MKASAPTERILRVKAHGRSYQMYELHGLGAGVAASKVAKCMTLGVPYERHLLERIHGMGLTGVAVDAGANVGNHTMWLAAICGLSVVAYEPLVAHDLVANVALNDLGDQVTVHAAALGDADDVAAHVGKGRLVTGDGDITVRTLDSYDLSNVVLIKADVEGMEAAVFRGGQVTIQRDHPVVFAEEWTDQEHKAIAAVLEPWGYRMTHRLAGKESPTPVGQWVHQHGEPR